MTLAIGKTEAGASRAAFTLIEIVLVIALIAVAASVVVTNFLAFADRGEVVSPEDTLRSAIRSARFHAASERRVTTIRFNKETGALALSSGESFSLDDDFGNEGRGEIRFYLVPPAQGLKPFPQPDRTQLETAEIAFAPDMSSSPFVAEIDAGSGNAVRLVFDPFSSLVRGAN
jgi:prepilin-type N-terminal cleavage/methylation domain-containing protein